MGVSDKCLSRPYLEGYYACLATATSIRRHVVFSSKRLFCIATIKFSLHRIGPRDKCFD